MSNEGLPLVEFLLVFLFPFQKRIVQNPMDYYEEKYEKLGMHKRLKQIERARLFGYVFYFIIFLVLLVCVN